MTAELVGDELTLMTNLYPASTGLPMVVWVGPREAMRAVSPRRPFDEALMGYSARRGPRIKVMQAHGTRMEPGNLAVVALLPQPHLIEGRLSADDLRAITAWIGLNEAAILAHWNGATDGVGLAQQLVR